MTPKRDAYSPAQLATFLAVLHDRHGLTAAAPCPLTPPMLNADGTPSDALSSTDPED